MRDTFRVSVGWDERGRLAADVQPARVGVAHGTPGGTAAWSKADTGGRDIVEYVSAGKPGIFEIGFEVTNGGRLPVALQGLGVADDLHPRREPNDQAAGVIVVFEPVTIDPGDSRFFMLQLSIEGEKVFVA